MGGVRGSPMGGPRGVVGTTGHGGPFVPHGGVVGTTGHAAPFVNHGGFAHDGHFVHGGAFVGGRWHAGPTHFFHPYYTFRPHVNLGFGLWAGYPFAYPYPFYYPYYSYNYVYPPLVDESYGSGYYTTTAPPVESGSVQAEPAQTNMGGLSFDVTPATAELFVDNTLVGTVGQFTATTQPLGLEAGRHRVELRAAGYRTLSFDVDVIAGQVIPYQGALERQ
jgi:hypothetical protein